MKNQRKSMAKKSDKKTTNRKNHNVGCLSGLIRLFYFGRRRSTPKQLSNGKDQILHKNRHGGTTELSNKSDLPRHSEQRNENIDPGDCTNLSGKDSSNKDGNKEEIALKHTAEKISGGTENKTKTVTSHDNKFRCNVSNQGSVFSQSLWSDLVVDLCKEENIDSKKFEKHKDILENIPSNMILKYFDPKQIKTVDAFQPNGYNPKISSSGALQQIVVLKPNKQHEGPRHSYRFTLKEIKRRMKEIKSEDKIKPTSITMDSLLHKIPYGSPKYIEQNEKATNTGQSTKLATLLQRQEEELNIDNSRESVSYDEGRKRLADMLHIDDRVHKIPSLRQPPKSLGRILSLPGFDSPSPMFSSRLSTETNDSPSYVSTNMYTEATQPMALFDIEDRSNGKDDWMDFSTDGLGCDSGRCNEEETQNISDSPSKALVTTGDNQQKDFIPLSIVEHVRDDDESISTQMWLKHLRSVFEGSGLDYNKLLDQLPDSSVFEELEIKYGQLNIDSNILLDYINEVFIEICTKFSHSTTPWISLIKPNITPTPTKEVFMHELCEGVERFIHKDFPSSLDHLTKMDLEHEIWQNIRLDIDDVVIEIGDVILDYIMEETVLELSNSIQAF